LVVARYGITTGRYQVALQQVAEDKESMGELVVASVTETSFMITA